MDNKLNCKLSVIVVTQTESKSFRMALDHLKAQTIASNLEIIIVVPSREEIKLIGEDFSGFFGHKILEVGRLKNWGESKAAGVRDASASLVAFFEDHSYPDPDWAKEIIHAHEKNDFAGVGPVVRNANPASAVSWCCFLIFYGDWMSAVHQEVKHLPGNHSCYKRSLLLGYGSRLPDMLQAESILHWDLLTKGHALYQEPSAKVYHLNYSSVRPIFSEYYFASRVFADNRCRHWKTWKKIVYVMGGPLLPLVRIWRILKGASGAGLDSSIVVKALPAMILTLSVGAFGEILGYAFGGGNAKELLAKFETKRFSYIKDGDLDEVLSLGFLKEV